MKSVRLVSYVIIACIPLFQNLSAGIVYATELVGLDGQRIFLYGDYHSTHEVDEDKERRAIDAFCKELTMVSEEILILCEDFKTPPFSTICSDQDYQILFPNSWNKGFIDVVSNFAHKNTNSTMQVQSIDPRVELVDLIAISFIYSLKMLDPLEDTKIFTVEKKIYEAIKNGNISGAFERLITNIKLFSEFTSNNKLRLIFNKIADTLQDRKAILWEKIITDTGLLKNELDQLTIKMVMNGILKADQKYTKFVDFFKDKDLMISYSLETVETEALWHIAGTKNPCKKIVVVAGAEHIYNLEKHLMTLGFEKGRSAGNDFRQADENKDHVKLYVDNVIDKKHKSRVRPLDPLDEFGQSLFSDDISTAWKKIHSQPDFLRPKKTNNAIKDYNAKIKKFYSYGSPPLVPFNTFKWINHKEKKRKRTSQAWIVHKKSKHS